MLIRSEMFTVPTWWLPSACEWGRWRAGWSPPRSRSTGSLRWSSSGRRSPEHYDTEVWPCHLKLGRRKRRAGVACRGVQHCLSAPRPSPRCFPFYHTCYESLLQARAEESTSKSAEVKIVQLSTWAVCLEDIWLPSSQHGATCSLHLMRNWTGPWAAISYPPSLPELIPICPLCASNVFAIVRSAPRMYYCTITTSQYCTYHPPSKYLSLFVRSAPQMYYCHLPRIVHTSHILSIVPATFQGSGPRLLLLPTSFSPPCFCLETRKSLLTIWRCPVKTGSIF